MEIPGYEIEKIIGKGGMASVYLALHKALNRKVAIKVMNRQQGTDSDFNDRFLREARIVANLTHPNIVTIHDVGEHDGHNYLVMELLPNGETLRDKIKKGVDSEHALSIIRQVATALKVAHDNNIVHRDIKPDNIMFRADGSVVLMDFGIARSVDSSATQVTQAGLIVGTPQYISPEQAEGKDIGPHSDIYSLGIVFYEMLMGKPPYTADTPIALVYKHVSAPVPDLTGDYAVYQPLLDRMMSKKREDRYSDCNHIIADLDKIGVRKPAINASENQGAATVDKNSMTAESINAAAVYLPLFNRMMDKTQKKDDSTCVDTIVDIDKTNAETPTTPATETLNPAAVNKGNATTETINTVVDAYADKGTGTNESNGIENLEIELEEKKAYSDSSAKITGAQKNGTESKLFLWLIPALLLAAGVYMFINIDTGKLKTLAGFDAGPVYTRVGRLISIPGGSYKMGNANGDSTEKPVHSVHINSFKLGETEVTQKQWRLVMGRATSYFKDCDNCPVDSVSWNDTQSFLKKLNKQTGLSFRLPSEAEWEYACRSAGKDEKYCGGGDESKLAWYGNNSDDKTRSVATKLANSSGLYDMSGNVWEWTQDCWHRSYTGAPSYGQAWKNGACKQRVLRGGSWIDLAGSLSSTGRFESSPAKRSRNFGFRVAQDL